MDSAPNNVQPADASTSNVDVGLPPTSGQDSELYNQIAAQDVAAPPPPKPKMKSPLVALMAAIMRLTLWVDSVKRTNQRFFAFLANVWACCMGVVYLSGILVLVFAIHNRLQLPIYLEDELKARNVQFETAEYSMDRIVVHNLKDKEGLYSVDTLIVNSTFADLLQKRIRSVTLDGLDIQLDASSDFNIVKEIPRLLSYLQNPARGKLNLDIQGITVNNAKISFQNQLVHIPISFTLESSYDNQTQIVMPMEISHAALQAKPRLTVSGTSANPEWTISVVKGSITLPRSAPESLDGEIKIVLAKDVLDFIQMNFKLGYGTIEKNIVANFKRKEDDTLSASITWDRSNLTEPDLSSHLAINLDKIELPDTQTLHISGPALITSKKLSLTDFGLSDLYALFDIDIQCQNWDTCITSLNKPSTITIKDLWLQNKTRFCSINRTS